MGKQSNKKVSHFRKKKRRQMAQASILSTTCPGNAAGSEVFGRYRFYPRAGATQEAYARGRLPVFLTSWGACGGMKATLPSAAWKHPCPSVNCSPLRRTDLQFFFAAFYMLLKGRLSYSQSPAGIRSTAWRKTGSTFVYTLLVRSDEECSSSLWVTAVETPS